MFRDWDSQDSVELARPDATYWVELRGRPADVDVPPPVPDKDDIFLPPSARKDTASTLPRSATGSSQRLPPSPASTSYQRGIKYGKGRYSKVELIPQPSDDPNDPLNWPQWRKELNLVSLLVMVGLIGGMKTVFISTNGVMAIDFNVSYSSVAALTAVPLILSTFTGLASLVAGRIIGKRPIYLLSFIFIFIGSIWNMTTEDSFGCSMGARIFQGLGWGAFDTLVLGSIQDTYFEHERNLRVSLYNVFTITTTWGSILIGGVASHNASSFSVQFRIINAFYFLAIPLLIVGVPETMFKRVKPGTPRPPGNETPPPQKPPRDKEGILQYVRGMQPWSFKGTTALPVLLQAPRALIAPTTGLVFLLSFLPYCFLWGFANAVALLLTPAPLELTPSSIGLLMTGPWLLATLVVAAFCFWRHFHENFTPKINLLSTAAGTFLFAVGTLAFGIVVFNTMTRGTDGDSDAVNMDAASELSLPVLSLLLGMLAAGVYVLDATTRPLIARSASFTSSNMTICQRCIGDMHASIVVLRNLFAGIFILAIPHAVATFDGLKSTVIGLSVTQIGLAGGIAALWWFFDESIWRADGKIMGLIDLDMLKRSPSQVAIDVY